MNFEEDRKRYHPGDIKVLFIGESPPAGGTFFYRGNSLLAQYTKEGFSIPYSCRFDSTSQFLELFKKSKCYLDDLCLYPVNKMSDLIREEERRKGVKGLSERLIIYKPLVIITIINYVKDHVAQAVSMANLNNVTVYNLPFPGRYNNRRYVSELSEVISKFIKEGILPKQLL